MEELRGEFDLLTSTSHREEESIADMEAEKLVKDVDREVEEIMVQLCDSQSQGLSKLTEDHKEVVSIVLNAIQDEDQIQAAFTNLESMSKASTNILPSMDADDAKLKEIMVKVAVSKTAAMQRINRGYDTY